MFFSEQLNQPMSGYWTGDIGFGLNFLKIELIYCQSVIGKILTIRRGFDGEPMQPQKVAQEMAVGKGRPRWLRA
jgi:hypothetical protein